MNQRIDRQRGWIGMIGLLLALAIVAYLAKDALLKYGMLPSGDRTVIKAGTPGERARMPAAVDASGTTIECGAGGPDHGDRQGTRRREHAEAAGKQTQRRVLEFPTATGGAGRGRA